MESIRAKFIAFCGVLVLMGAIIATGYLLLVQKTAYWVQIDNSNVQQNSKGEYVYQLTAYDAHGKMQDVEFTAYKELRQDAFLKLDLVKIRGVIYWEEVQYDELPLDLKTRYHASL